MNQWDWARLAIRVKVKATGKYTPEDRAATWFLPRSPLSASMALTRLMMNKAKRNRDKDQGGIQ